MIYDLTKTRRHPKSIKQQLKTVFLQPIEMYIYIYIFIGILNVGITKQTVHLSSIFFAQCQLTKEIFFKQLSANIF
jgi:hypothetical protein